MAFYALSMAAIASILNRSGRRPTLDLVLKFLEHFAQIRQAMATQGVWDGADGFYYDKLVGPDGRAVPVKVRSMVGVIPLVAAVVIDEEAIGRAETVGKAFARLLREVGGPGSLAAQGLVREPAIGGCSSAWSGSSTSPSCSPSCSTRASSCRPTAWALSAFHRDHPYELEVDGFRASIDYEPAESTTGMFGGNSNWRGPIWFAQLPADQRPRALRFFGDELTVEYPTGGPRRTLDQVAADLRRRLVDLFVVGPDGRRPCFGVDRLQRDPAWSGNLVFNEYFHGDDGAGLGASQTGWTGLVADLIRGRPSADGVYAIGDLGGVVDRARP